MAPADAPVTFDRLTDLELDEPPTFIEGLPGHGLVAAIAIDQITTQLGLAHHGNIVSEHIPPIASFDDGRIRDPVRVYAGPPGVMTLQSDMPLPERAFEALGTCVLEELAPEFELAIFLAGAPAQSKEELGEVRGVATSDAVEARLRDADIELADGTGLIGGVTGALVSACDHADVPAAVLIVQANPYVPDPAAARAVIEDALEPLVDFDIDTTELEVEADQIQQQLQRIASQYQEMSERSPTSDRPPGPSMYQ